VNSIIQSKLKIFLEKCYRSSEDMKNQFWPSNQGRLLVKVVFEFKFEGPHLAENVAFWENG
jgi:hypothetical protein